MSRRKGTLRKQRVSGRVVIIVASLLLIGVFIAMLVIVDKNKLSGSSAMIVFGITAFVEIVITSITVSILKSE